MDGYSAKTYVEEIAYVLDAVITVKVETGTGAYTSVTVDDMKISVGAKHYKEWSSKSDEEILQETVSLKIDFLPVMPGLPLSLTHQG